MPWRVCLPATSQQIAATTGLNERYVREWLGAMVVGRIVVHDPANGTYTLPPEHAASLTRSAGADNLAMFAQYIPLLGNVEEGIIESFRNGGGVPYSAYPRFQQLQAEETRRVFDATLIDTTLPLVPGLTQRLRAGMDVADVGCGQGHAINLMAQAFPNSRFTGYDFSEEGIGAGKAEAERMRLKNVRFEVKDVATLDASGEYGLITAFDVIHELAQPAQVLKKIFDALRTDGTFLMVDVAASSNVIENIEHPLGPALYTFSAMHCMTVSLAQHGEGLGTVWGEQKARQMLTDAGFTQVEVKQVPGDILNNYYIASRREEDEMTSKMDSSTLKTARQRLEARLQAFYDAWQVRSGPDIRKLFSDDERLLLWGTDRWERVRGRAEADREFDRWIDTCPPWTSFEVTYREMDVRDGIAWVAEEVTGLWSRDTESGATHFRITTVWEEKGGEWKVIHAHIDLPLD